jgi:hypothetical protein
MADNSSGWADLGNHARVIDTMDRHNVEPDWLREMREAKTSTLNNVQMYLGEERARVRRNIATA